MNECILFTFIIALPVQHCVCILRSW